MLFAERVLLLLFHTLDTHKYMHTCNNIGIYIYIYIIEKEIITTKLYEMVDL